MRTANALFGIPGASLNNINKENASLLREEALNVTATSDLLLAGVLHAVSTRLATRWGRTPESYFWFTWIELPGHFTWHEHGVHQSQRHHGCIVFLASPCLGVAISGPIRLKRSGRTFLFESTTFVANASYITSPAYRGQSLTLNSLARLGQQWQFDTFVLLYHQQDSFNVELYRVTPTVSHQLSLSRQLDLRGHRRG